jgi:uncharacterized protein (TIGR03083 family)
MSDALNALRSSANRLTRLVRPLGDTAITGRAYPAEWTIADVLSHLGSGAVISQRRLDDTLSGTATPDTFNPAVWDEWNAKSPRAKADDGLAATEAFTARLEAVTPADRSRFALAMGPLELDWNAFIGMRLNEQLLHEWDVAVALEPSATLPPDGTELVIDNLDIIARFTARPAGDARTITVVTTSPDRSFDITIEPSSVTFAAADAVASPDLRMPSEAFIRLVYGRLDPDQAAAPTTGDTGAIEQLRNVFPGP